MLWEHPSETKEQDRLIKTPLLSLLLCHIKVTLRIGIDRYNWMIIIVVNLKLLKTPNNIKASCSYFVGYFFPSLVLVSDPCLSSMMYSMNQKQTFHFWHISIRNGETEIFIMCRNIIVTIGIIICPCYVVTINVYHQISMNIDVFRMAWNNF